MKSTKTTGGLVYSTEHGSMCPECRKPIAGCICSRNAAMPAIDGIVRVSRETKGRKGKGVTLVKGLALEPAGLTELGRRLKAACGAGGTVKDDVIELQGDHREVVIASLRKAGWTVKPAGG